MLSVEQPARVVGRVGCDARQRPIRHFQQSNVDPAGGAAQFSGKFDAGRTRADDRDPQPLPLARRYPCGLHQDRAMESLGPLRRIESVAMLGYAGYAEVVHGAPDRQYRGVELQRSLRQQFGPARRVSGPPPPARSRPSYRSISPRPRRR
jgi:hypothetical protein